MANSADIARWRADFERWCVERAAISIAKKPPFDFYEHRETRMAWAGYVAGRQRLGRAAPPPATSNEVTK